MLNVTGLLLYESYKFIGGSCTLVYNKEEHVTSVKIILFMKKVSTFVCFVFVPPIALLYFEIVIDDIWIVI